MDKDLRLREVGEAGLLARIFERLGPPEKEVILGPGDDAAVLAGSNDAVVFASDAMVEGVHFDLAFMTAADVGWRLTCANLSDLAAMGAAPWAAVLSAAAPPATPVAEVEGFFEGAAELARNEGLALVGGDVVASPARIFFAMAILGKTAEGHFLKRRGASPGEVLMLSGEIGLSRAGLDLARGEGTCSPGAAEAAYARFRRPTPRLALGRRLAAGGLATAALDTSDSLSESAAHLAAASAAGVTLTAASLPIAEAARAVAASRRTDPAAYALAAGEDFELLFTCPPEGVPAARQAAAEAGVAVHAIGEITEAEKGLRLAAHGEEKPLAPEGFAHF